MGTTPHVYLNNRRIAYAKELLWTTNCTVEVISLKSGFINTASFYRAFKRITGTTPRQFRKL
jgi:AraC-like DNA-binding protein